MTDPITAPDLIRAEIRRLANAKAIKYGEPVPEDDDDTVQEAECELRGDYDCDAIGIPEWRDSRHYECKAVAKKIGDRWVCWLYWFGGGKHGEPDAIDWIEDARYVEEAEPIMTKAFRACPQPGATP